MHPFSFNQIQKALLTAGAFSSLSIITTALYANTAQLETITITADADSPVPKTALFGLGQQTLAEVPASISTVSSKQIADQHAKNLADIIKNDAAAGEGYAPIGYYGNFMMRGFYLNLGSSYLINGSLLRGEQNTALENKEQVEFLKGISALQSGMSTPGGVINYVTKRPETIRALTADADSYGGSRIALDTGDFFGADQQFGYRVNLAKEEIHPNVDHANGDRLFGSLALDWNISEQSKLEFDIESQRQRQRSVPGYQLLDNAALPQNVDWDRLLGYQSWAKPVTTESLNTSLKFSHQLNDSWQANLTASDSQAITDDYSAFPWGCYSSICQTTGLGNTFDQNGNYDVYDFQGPNDRYQTTQFKAGLNGEVQTGAWLHQLSFELSQAYKRHAQHEAINEYVGTGNIYEDQEQFGPSSTGVLGPHYKSLDSKQTALNVLDHIDFNEQWSVLAGGKLLHINESAYDPSGEKNRDTDFNRFLPQFAVMYQPWEQTHLYASYTKGITDGGQAPWYATGNPDKGILGNAYATLAPTHSTQYELGVKQQWQSLLFSAALFDLKQDNQYTNLDNYYVTEGQQHNIGLEFSLQGALTPQLEINSALALTRARLEDVQIGEYEGHQMQNIPKIRFATQLAYAVPQIEGLRLLTGMQYSDSKNANKLGNVEVPSYTIFDLGAAYSFYAYGAENTVKLNIENLTNKKYWRDASGYMGDDYLFLGTPRTAQLSWTLRFK